MSRITYAILIVAGVVIQYSFGEILKAERWKRETCRRHQFHCNSGTCVDVFLLCDGIIHCDDGSDESADICMGKRCPTLAFQCAYGACIDKVGVCNGVKECADGSDESPEKCGVGSPEYRPLPSVGSVPKKQNGSQVSCPMLVDLTREIVCKLNNIEVDCEKPLAPGTTAVVQCNSFYTHAKEFSRFDAICQSNGTWSREIMPCIPKCGEPNPNGLPFIAGGIEAKSGEFPWNVGIYRLTDGRYVQICGGNIISERVIVTAGHCFWNDGTSEKADFRNYKVAVGKYYRDWYNEQERFVQTPEVEKIVLHNRFRGSRLHWQNDIALVILKDTIQMTLAIRPICVDFDKRYESLFTPGKRGIIVGWGVTETMRPGETLQKSTLPYVEFEECEKEVPQSFLTFLTNEKFCAGYLNGTSVCPGDGGGGFAAQFSDGKWYLMGIASVGVPGRNGKSCSVNDYATFTRVSDYYSFIENNKM